ncbi:regulatory protein GemA [Pyruvatibacter sp.]|uniref:gp16 family protein n=1 Tax=Pyruvatibacter sp. TaxID=1981328 RepID=UPI0032EE10DE
MSRTQLIRKIHVGKRELGLDDDTYRDLVERVTGKRSAADCDVNQLTLVVDEMKARGFHVKQMGQHKGQRKGPAQLAKMRALWITAWCLRIVRDRRDSALLAFTVRQTGRPVGALHWVTPDDANKVIEALKDMCTRAGFDVPANGQEAKHHLAVWLAAELRTGGYKVPFSRADLDRMSGTDLDHANMAMRQLLGETPAQPFGGGDAS